MIYGRNRMEAALTRETIIAVIWFMLGFGAGLFILSFWKYFIAAIVVAITLPIVLPLIGLNIPLTPEAVTRAFTTGINMLADLLAENRYSIYGFIAGAVLGLFTALLRLQRSIRTG
jgi:fumarate reductase subunit D